MNNRMLAMHSGTWETLQLAWEHSDAGTLSQHCLSDQKGMLNRCSCRHVNGIYGADQFSPGAPPT